MSPAMSRVPQKGNRVRKMVARGPPPGRHGPGTAAPNCSDGSSTSSFLLRSRGVVWDAAVWVVKHDEAVMRAVTPGQRSAGMHDDALLVELHRGRELGGTRRLGTAVRPGRRATR